jgi:hypothetical protein
MNRPKGILTVSGIKLADGKVLSTQQAVDYGWIKPVAGQCHWGRTSSWIKAARS